MLKFFRKIREKLIIDGNLKRYLIYAVGEILLVMIGILLALQVNKWNEQLKNNKLETLYLERLIEDIEADTTYYKERIVFTKMAAGNMKAYIHKIYETQKSLEDVKDIWRYLTLNTDHLSSQNDTYHELINSGKFDLIHNHELKKSITDYYGYSEDLALQIEEFNLVSTQYLVEAHRTVKNFGKFVSMDVQIVSGQSPYDDPTMFREDEWKFINDPSSEKFQALESMAFMYWIRFNEHLDFFIKLKSKSSDLIYLINEEIDVQK